MDYEQIKDELKKLVANLDVEGYKKYIQFVELKSKLLGDDYNFYPKMLEIAKDIFTKEMVLSMRGEPSYQSDDVIVHLDSDGYLDTLWLRNEGKNTFRIIQERIDFDD